VLGRHDHIPLVFTVGIIHNNHHASLSEVRYDFIDGVELLRHKP